ncbi:uncharacterized protein LOC124192704 isoform X2 [Daphnia pulex]|nr:uncharacterized protein LOC124192704 isoform X2 [Daphnia pulex]
MANLGYSIFCIMKTLWKDLPANEKTRYKVKATQISYYAYFETLTPEEQKDELFSFEGISLQIFCNSLWIVKPTSATLASPERSSDPQSDISRLWMELSEEEKTEYNEEATQANYSYKMKYAAFLDTLTPEQKEFELFKLYRMASKRLKMARH